MSSNQERRLLLRDDRGAVMVVGVFMMLLWVGLIWTLFGVGNAIAYRENMQNAADAAAFAGAVYDARGMNLIAVINNLMGAALMALIAMKLAQLANLVHQGADCKKAELECIEAAATIVGSPLCAVDAYRCIWDCESVLTMRDTAAQLDQGVHQGLLAMHGAEGLIAKGWPYVASQKSSLGGTSPNFYAGGVTATVSYSYAENPASSDPSSSSPPAGNCPAYPDGSGTVPDGPCPMGPRCGLPVTSDRYASLCQVSINNFLTVGGIVPDDAARFISGGTDAIYNLASEWLCDDGTAPGLNPFFTPWATTIASYALFPECTLGHDLSSAIGDIVRGGSIRNGGLSLIPMSGPDIPTTCPAYSPMALYGRAKMGLDYYSVWGSATGVWDKSHKDFAANAVQVAGISSKSRAVVADSPDDATKAWARAEYYYEPRGSVGGNVSSNDTTDSESTVHPPNYASQNAMWNMRWRARLRRFHFMPSGAIAAIPGAGGHVDLAAYTMQLASSSDVVVKLAQAGVVPSAAAVADVEKQANTPPPVMSH